MYLVHNFPYPRNSTSRSRPFNKFNMGKSKVKNVKRAQRIAAVAEEVETAIGEKSQNESYRVMKDDELFHVDTGLPSTTILVKEAKKGVSAAMKRAIAQQAKKVNIIFNYLII